LTRSDGLITTAPERQPHRQRPGHDGRRVRQRQRGQRAGPITRRGPIASSTNGCEREESKWRRQAVYTTVALFLSTFMVAMLKPSIFGALPTLWQIALTVLFGIGVWHLGSNIKRQLDHYTYRPVMISLMRYRKPDERYSRGAALAFIGGGYLLSLGTGMLIGALTEDFTSQLFGAPSLENLIFGVLFYPPIIVLIVDMMYQVNQRFDEW